MTPPNQVGQGSTAAVPLLIEVIRAFHPPEMSFTKPASFIFLMSVMALTASGELTMMSPSRLKYMVPCNWSSSWKRFAESC